LLTSTKGELDMAAKRVLIVLGKLKRGGAETLVMNIYRTIDRSVVQFDFIVHTPDRYDYDDEIESLGGKIYRFPQYNVLNHFEYKRCWNRFFAEHPEYRIIHAHMTGSASVFLPIAKKYGLVTIAHSHIALSQKGIRQKVIDLYRLPLKNQADYLFACSNDAGVWMYGEKATKRGNYYIIRNGVDTDKFAFSSDKRDKIRAELGLDGKFVIGNVSRFHIQKNHYLLIDVFAEIKKENGNAVLLLVGDGDLRGAIEEKVKSLGLADSVIFTGVRTDIDCILSAMDVFIMTSFNEGLPVSLVEAQASGLHIVATDTISSEINLTDLVEFCSLDDSPKKWACTALKYADGYERRNTKAEIAASGYDIVSTTEELKQFYLKNWHE